MQKVPAEDQRIRFDLVTQLYQGLIKHRTLMQIGGDEDSGRHGVTKAYSRTIARLLLLPLCVPLSYL
jgi:hypothetical protein